MKKYLKIFLASSLLCSPLFVSSSLNAMKQPYSISHQNELIYGIDYIKKNYNMKIYTSYVPEREFVFLDNYIDWKKYAEMLNRELKHYPKDNSGKMPFFFLITFDDSPSAIGIIREDTCLHMIIKSKFIDGIDERFIDELIKKNRHSILQNPPPAEKSLEIYKNDEISIVHEKSDQKPILQSERQNVNNFSIVCKSKPEPQELKTENTSLYIEGKRNFLYRNINMIGLKDKYNFNDLDNYNSDECKQPDYNCECNDYDLNEDRYYNMNPSKSSESEDGLDQIFTNFNKYTEKNTIATLPVKKCSKEEFYKYLQDLEKETLNAKSNHITTNKYTTESIKEKLLKDEEYNNLLKEQEKVMQQLVDSKESNRIKDNPGEYGLRYINPELVDVPKDYKMPEKEKYEISDKIGNNITENNIGMRSKLYSQDENNPARIFNQKLNNFSLKKGINFIGLYNALTLHDIIKLGQGGTYYRALENKPLENFDFIKGEIIKR